MRFSLAIVLALSAAPARSAPVDFNRDVRPILSGQCFQCHGPDEKARKAKLRLDIRDDAVKAGAIVPGKPDESELLKRIVSTDAETRMPPGASKKPPLTVAQVATVKQWIAEGAKYSDHWSFGKLTQPEVPKLDAKNPIDAFLRYRYQQEGVKPAAEADRVALIRRLSFDLTGLPPSAEDVRAFVADKSLDAYEKLVEKLLASPHYGERMAVWWLDLVRYANSAGYHSDNDINVAPYREYVIRSFNENKPFDLFTTEQLAGDLLPKPTTWQRVGTAYNRLLQTTEEGGAQAKEYEAKYSADRVRNYAQVWLGATLMCAECHNHKFDPYTQADFYSVAAFFADVQEAPIGRREPGMAVPTPEQSAFLQQLNAGVFNQQLAFDDAAAEFVAKPDAFKDVAKWPNPKGPVPKKKGKGEADKSEFVSVPDDIKKILDTDPKKRSKAETEKLAAFAKDNAPELKKERETFAAVLKEKTDFENSLPRTLVTTAAAPRTVRILKRGDWQDTTGQVMLPATPSFLPPLPPLAKEQKRYTRLDLAKWTVSKDNPLTARVAANRLWKLFFGRGISRSLEESGSQGEQPTHPELLDWLASEFHTKWDVKHLVRLMVTSAAYRMSSAETPAVRERDPSNLLFARQARSRLDAEFVRDNALAVSGLLVRTVGGETVKPYQPRKYWEALNFPVREWQNDTGAKIYRRGMYTHWQRTFPHPAMLAFDAPNREECTCERPKSNIPQQALVLLNDPEFVEAARVFAANTLAAGKDDAGRIAWAFERATGRVPKGEEAKVLVGVLAKHRKDYAADAKAADALLKVGESPAPKDVPAAELAAWTSVCRVVLNVHETITRP
ncbi:MAG TPA: PSD1 and planctomycete cytochrome C domain-containing protein [Gemmataceae bacterium]|nr:PSD1 and planctomycete cytochrome C domain-containing protein [Gemmataceae bacterium]